MGAEMTELADDDHERIVRFVDPSVGLHAIVAVHSTVLGPAMGGTRFLPYRSEDEALTDVRRLARGMTYKQALAGTPYGGGKAVILGDPRTDRTETLIRSYARFLHRLEGIYLTAEDVGTTQADMDLIAEETPHVTGTSPERGGSGDPSPATAWGLLHAMEAAAQHRWGDPSLSGRRVVVAGVGKVGAALAAHLREAGAEVVVADPDPDAVATVTAHLEVEVVDHRGAHRVPCDVFSPCALGGVLDRRTIPELRCEAIVGAANNQLAEPDGAGRLAAAGITYVPDYVANAGGVINISEEPAGYDRARAFERVRRIGETTAQVLARAAAAGTSTAAAADLLAEERLRRGGADG